MPKGHLPAPLATAWFALQERVIWPLEDRFTLLGPGPSNRAVLGGGAVALVLVGVVAALLLSSGSGSSSPGTTVTEAAAQPEALATTPTSPQPKPKKETAPRETLHGAAPVFSPPSTAIKEGEKTGGLKPRFQTTSNGSSGASTGAQGSATTSSPASARISSDPKHSKAGSAASAAGDTATAARATVPTGPPAGPAALKVAREFAQGFLVYETGGEAAEFKDAFRSTATPELAKALLKRPPKQPAGVKVPRARVLNVLAGPSQGTVYEVSVSLLRVGVTSELRLQMEKLKSAGGGAGKGAEWRVTNVLG